MERHLNVGDRSLSLGRVEHPLHFVQMLYAEQHALALGDFGVVLLLQSLVLSCDLPLVVLGILKGRGHLSQFPF